MKFAARLAFTLLLVSAAPVFACTQPVSVCGKAASSSFSLIANGQPAAVFIDAQANSAVRLAATSFVGDLERVSG